MQNKKAKNKRNSRQKGFSLIEVLIAIAILAAITIPLAMNMISTSQINSKSKSTSTAADLSASVLESMQSVNLSDLLVEMNGYDTNEYGEKLAYSIADNSLHGFTVGNKFEARVSEEGKKSYVPVQKQTDGIADSLVTSSIKVRKTNDDVIKTYFTGHKNENGKIDKSYSVVMQDVHNDEDSFDIVMDFEEGQSYEMANINAMDQSNVVSMFEPSEDEKDVISTIIGDNSMAHSISNSTLLLGNADDSDDEITISDATKLSRYLEEGHEFTNDEKQAFDVNGDRKVDEKDAQAIQNYVAHSASTYGKIYNKEYTITIQQDKNTEAANIIIDCKYNIVYPGLVGDKNVITKKIGVFSTNSTFEFTKGIYLYYIPNGGDNFIINNRNELSATVYLIASTTDNDFLSTYHPSITINELSSQVYADSARTTVCSNIEDDKWTPKTVVPAKNNPLKIKTLANVGSQQTLYNVSVKIYKHNKASFNADNVFEPNEKNLLIQTDGSFLDNSVMHDIDSNKTTGVSETDKLASVVPGKVVYNGESQSGYTAANVTLSGKTEAVDAGRYTIFATPKPGYAWADGTNTQKSFDWEIQCLKVAKAWIPSGQSEIVYDGQIHSPVVGEHVTMSDHTHENDVGLFTVEVTPEKNYAWEDAAAGKEAETRYIYWAITPKPVTVNWTATTWTFDGLTHIAKCEVNPNDLVSGDSCNVTLNNHMIKNVGSQKATVMSLTNSNYKLATSSQKEQTIKVLSNGTVEPITTNFTFTYDGKEHKIEFSSNDAIKTISGHKATNAGEYKAKVKLKSGYKWTDGSSEEKTFAWRIVPAEIHVKWGKPEWYPHANGWSTIDNVKYLFANNTITEIQWTYDGKSHQVEDFYFVDANGNNIKSLKDSTRLENNTITEVGEKTIRINGFEDDVYDNNYKCNDTLKISVAPKGAYFKAEDPSFKYTGAPQSFDPDSEEYVFEYDNVQIVPIQVSGQSYPVTWNGGAPDGYVSGEEYTIENVMTQTNAGTYTIQLKPMDNYVWEGAEAGKETEIKTFSWTIAPVKDAWISGMTYDEKTGILNMSELTYSYTGGMLKCAYGENITLSFDTVNDAIKHGTKKAETRDDGLADTIETTWLELKGTAGDNEKYTVKATPMVNHAWMDGTTTEKTIEFVIGDPVYEAIFNMSPIVWLSSTYRYYNGEEIGPYFTDLAESYKLKDVCVNENGKTIIGGKFKNKNTLIEISGDKEKSEPGQYTLRYRNSAKSSEFENFNWEIKKRPIKIESVSVQTSNVNSVDDIESKIISAIEPKASEDLINEAISFGFATESNDTISPVMIDGKPLYQVMGYNEAITDIAITVYRDGQKVQNMLTAGTYTFEIKSVKITNSNGTDVTDCYEIDLEDAKGTIKLTSIGQTALDGGIGVAVDLFSQDCVLVGDVDGDYDITTTDAVLIKKYAIETIKDFTNRQKIAADVNGDGDVNNTDAMMLEKYVNGNRNLGNDCKIGRIISAH